MECTICLNDIESPNSCKQLRCGHVFHKMCINQWFESKNSCPTCRKEVFVIKSQKELDDEWLYVKSNEHSDLIDCVIDFFEEELESIKNVSCRKYTLYELYANIYAMEMNYKKLIKLSDYLNEDIDINLLPELEEIYGYDVEMMKRHRLHERCETDSFIEPDTMTNYLFICS